jgi:hypothetical protein
MDGVMAWMTWEYPLLAWKSLWCVFRSEIWWWYSYIYSVHIMIMCIYIYILYDHYEWLWCVNGTSVYMQWYMYTSYLNSMGNSPVFSFQAKTRFGRQLQRTARLQFMGFCITCATKKYGYSHGIPGIVVLCRWLSWFKFGYDKGSS